jgi:hypothetical protein
MVGTGTRMLRQVTGWKRLLLMAFAFALLLGVAATALPLDQANASAYGATNWGPKIPGTTLPMGTFCTYISGDKLYVNYIKGYPNLNAPVGTISNWRIKVEFRDDYGTIWMTRYSPIQYGSFSYWKQANTQFVSINQTVRSGNALCTLLSNGVPMCTQWFRIK